MEENSTPAKTVKPANPGAPGPDGQRRSLSSTLPIPVDSVLRDIPIENVAHLVVRCPEQEPTSVSLGRETLSLGRDQDCEIVLDLPNVSRRHARVFWTGEDYVIEDLGSTNGVSVNNVRVNRCILRTNDHIRVGEATLVYIQQKRIVERP